MICEAMEFHHLPVAGGIYDQHPQLIEDWMEIWQRRAAHEKREESKKPKTKGKRARL